MTVEEIMRLVGKSRRSVMRLVDEGKLPAPTELNPMSWRAGEVRQAHKRMQQEEQHGRTHDGRKRNGRKRRARVARLARAQGQARDEG